MKLILEFTKNSTKALQFKSTLLAQIEHDQPIRKVWVLLIHTLGIHYMLKVCIIRHKICVWAVPRCVWSSLDTSWLDNCAIREE